MTSTGPEGRSVPHLSFPASVAERLEETPVEYPGHGKHTDEILRKLGIDPGE